jgi:hypothetical protein
VPRGTTSQTFTLCVRVEKIVTPAWGSFSVNSPCHGRLVLPLRLAFSECRSGGPSADRKVRSF